MTYTFTLEALQGFFLKNKQATFLNNQAAAHALREICPDICNVFVENQKVKIWVNDQNAFLIPSEIKAIAKNAYEDQEYITRLYYRRGPKTLFDIATNW